MNRELLSYRHKSHDCLKYVLCSKKYENIPTEEEMTQDIKNKLKEKADNAQKK